MPKRPSRPAPWRCPLPRQSPRRHPGVLPAAAASRPVARLRALYGAPVLQPLLRSMPLPKWSTALMDTQHPIYFLPRREWHTPGMTFSCCQVRALLWTIASPSDNMLGWHGMYGELPASYCRPQASSISERRRSRLGRASRAGSPSTHRSSAPRWIR